MRTPTIETDRLVLRPLSLDDAQVAFDRWTSDPEVPKFMPYEAHKSIDDTIEWLSSIDNNSDTSYDFGICIRNEGNYLCGSCGLYYEPEMNCFSVGYNLAKNRWRNGYGTEVMRALVEFGIKTLKQTQLYAQYHVDNVVSGHVLRKCGFEDVSRGTALKFDGVTTYPVIKLRYKVKDSKKTFLLNNGNKIEPIGFGTYLAEPGSIENAVKVGYRYFDTASFYKNEELVGAELKKGGIPRDKLFIASKAWPTEMGYEEVQQAFNRSIKKLGTDHLDLYLIHWPKISPDDGEWRRKICETWKGMEKLVKDGYIRNIGVSNFLPHHLRPILNDCEIRPQVNQLELHIGYMQNYAVSFCKENNIHVQAWSPMGRGRISENEDIKRLAESYLATPQQFMLRFLNQQGISVIPKSNTTKNMLANLEIFDFTINNDDMSFLMSLPEFGFSGEFPDTAVFEGR